MLDDSISFEERRAYVNRTFQGLDNRDVAHWLHRAKSFRDSLCPDGLTVETNSHSTATSAYVHLTMPGEAPLLVWYKTNWCSSNYEFNERGKISGIQPGCDFIAPVLTSFFIAVRDRLRDIELAHIDTKEREHKAQIDAKKELIDRYRQRFA